MKPYLSIIIPYYNSPSHLVRLLGSIKKSVNAPSYEVVIVDDGSKKEFAVDGLWFMDQKNKLQTKNFQLRTVRLQTNRGPAIARNRGVERAKGTFVVFLDGDVEVFPDTFAQIAKIFRDDPDVLALTGVWVKEQKSKDFFPNFKALRDWSYWINERDKSGYYFLFSTRIASIKRSVFLRLGGFDETYPAPLVEDIELTYRIARRYAIIFAPQVRVRHEFEHFWPIARKYFLRAYYWTKLYAKRKKFDPVATTLQEAIVTLSAVAVVVSAAMSLVSVIATMGVLTVPVLRVFGLLAITLFVHGVLMRTFLLFIYHEKGLLFAIKGFGVGLVLYCFIFTGALWGRVFSRFKN